MWSRHQSLCLGVIGPPTKTFCSLKDNFGSCKIKNGFGIRLRMRKGEHPHYAQKLVPNWFDAILISNVLKSFFEAWFFFKKVWLVQISGQNSLVSKICSIISSTIRHDPLYLQKYDWFLAHENSYVKIIKGYPNI